MEVCPDMELSIFPNIGPMPHPVYISCCPKYPTYAVTEWWAVCPRNLVALIKVLASYSPALVCIDQGLRSQSGHGWLQMGVNIDHWAWFWEWDLCSGGRYLSCVLKLHSDHHRPWCMALSVVSLDISMIFKSFKAACNAICLRKFFHC